MRWLLSLLWVAVACSCATTIDYSPSSSVTSQEALAIAESYRVHRWRPTEANALHGDDPNGIRVDTPDISMPEGIAERAGWWKPNSTNQGIPYKWGGFDTPQEFSTKIAKGFYAGDVYTDKKRALLYDGVSEYTAGVDCSGFISRCWRLDRPYSTRELPELCVELQSYDELRPGDILNKRNVHALLFVKFLDPKKKTILAYETGSPPTWKVLRHPVSVDYVRGLGFKPYRYKGMR